MTIGAAFTLHVKPGPMRVSSYVANDIRICLDANLRPVVAFICSGILTQIPVDEVEKLEVGSWTHCHNCDQSLRTAPFLHPVVAAYAPPPMKSCSCVVEHDPVCHNSTSTDT